MSKPVLILELNEFNVELLTSAIKSYDLPFLSKILKMPSANYRIQDKYDSGFLEPWVQWVCVHAGIPSASHQIKHLGDVPDLEFEQCWQTLSNHGIATGIWGVMNGARRNAEKTAFFLPDPWTFSESAYPNELNSLLDLPRYISKNYQSLNKFALIGKGLKLLKFIFSSGVAFSIIKETLALVKHIIHHGKKHFVFISYFDYISTLLFAEYKKRYQPQCSILFLNSLAHLQHHHWKKGTQTVTPEILFGLQYIDKILGYLLTRFPQDAIVMHNGLSQMNTNHEKPWVLYRQKNPIMMLKSLGVPITHVEQHMTHDGHLFFASSLDCENTFEKLKNASINGQPIFHVERNASDNRKLFVMLSFTDALEDKNITFTYDGKTFAFFDHFDEIVTRTGRHIPIGTIYSDTIEFKGIMQNHEFNQYLFHYFLPVHFPYPSQKQEITLDLANKYISEPVICSQ